MINHPCAWLVFVLFGSLRSSPAQSSVPEVPTRSEPASSGGDGRERSAKAREPLDGAGGNFAARSLELGMGLGCEPDWIPGFGGGEGLDSLGVYALTAHDDGSGGGSSLFVGGSFHTAGDVAADNIARWDGSAWSPVGGGMDNSVKALALFDDGSGNGPELYAGGRFTTAGGVSASRVAKWDGSSWSALGSGLTTAVETLAVYDDGSGSGPALYAGGSFSSCIKKWDGTAWTSVGGGANNTVIALTVYDDGSGSGPALFAGGYFSAAGGVPAARIAKWDGTAWSALGSGLSAEPRALTVYDDGSGGGPALFAAGNFTTAGGASALRIAKWDGTSWSPLSFGLFSAAEALTVHDDGTGDGPALHVGGHFLFASGVRVNYVAKWNGTAWSSLLEGTDQTVFALGEYDDGSGRGSALYVGGAFASASGVGAHRIAKWGGGAWSALGGTGATDEVDDVIVHDDGSGAGPALYVAGHFLSAGAVTLNHLGKWDGTSWSPLGAGVSDPVLALAVHDDGTGNGPALYAAGDFRDAGGSTLNHVGRWDGRAWSALGTTALGVLAAQPGTDGLVRALAVYDDGSGSGPALYAAGDFEVAGGVSANHVAKWDGSAWSALGSGTNDSVLALAVFDDGSGGGPALYAAGWFTQAGGTTVGRIAKWDGTTWTALGSGLDNSVLEIGSYDDGAGGGSSLYVGGRFLVAGGVSAPRLAKWNGASWSAVGSDPLNDAVHALTVYDPGTGAGPALVVGGEFTLSPAGDSYVALWGGCASPLPATSSTSYCFGDGTGAPCPCGNAGGPGRGCANGTGSGARLDALGTNSVAADDAVLACGGLVPDQPGLYFQGDDSIQDGLGLPFGDGLRCAGGIIRRLEVVLADPRGFAQSSVSLVEEGGVSAGETRSYQLGYRDSVTSPCGTRFNVSNALRIAWRP